MTFWPRCSRPVIRWSVGHRERCTAPPRSRARGRDGRRHRRRYAARRRRCDPVGRSCPRRGGSGRPRADRRPRRYGEPEHGASGRTAGAQRISRPSRQEFGARGGARPSHGERPLRPCGGGRVHRRGAVEPVSRGAAGCGAQRDGSSLHLSSHQAAARAAQGAGEVDPHLCARRRAAFRDRRGDGDLEAADQPFAPRLAALLRQPVPTSDLRDQIGLERKGRLLAQKIAERVAAEAAAHA